MKFVHFDMSPIGIETKKPITELVVFNEFELFVDWNFSKVASLVAKICPIICIGRN